MSLSATSVTAYRMSFSALKHLKKYCVTNAASECSGFGQPHRLISKDRDGRAKRNKETHPLH